MARRRLDGARQTPSRMGAPLLPPMTRLTHPMKGYYRSPARAIHARPDKLASSERAALTTSSRSQSGVSVASQPRTQPKSQPKSQRSAGDENAAAHLAAELERARSRQVKSILDTKN